MLGRDAMLKQINESIKEVSKRLAKLQGEREGRVLPREGRMTYLTMCTPHGWFAYNDTTKEIESEPFLTEAGAKAEAERLELQAWHAAKPKVALAERVEWDLSDPTEALLSIIEKPFAERMTFVEAA